MRHRYAVVCRAAVLVAALFLGTLAAPAAATAQDVPPEPQRFNADSGDRCRYGSTEGWLYRRQVNPPDHAVYVRGVVVDRPATDDEIACRDDGYYSVANFAAYSGDRPVDEEAQRVDNARRNINFALAYWGAIDRIVIQVCRHSRLGGRSYCGVPQEYRV